MAQTPASTNLLTQDLIGGFTREDGRGLDVLYRLIRPTDDLVAITDLLHRAYAPLAQAGMRFLASHQSVDVTRQRMARGDTIVALNANRVINVVTLSRVSDTAGAPFYDRPDVASFGQFAVEPDHQRAGIGSTLLDIVEALAVEHGVGQLALDTSEQALDLIRSYTARGFAFVAHHRWPDVNYRSVILAKAPGR